MTTLGELATLVRSKNAGPFWLTVDIFLPDAAAYERAAASPVLMNIDSMAERYDVAPGEMKIFRLPDLRAIKISFPRPSAQGGAHDRDMHGGQQYVPLLDIEIA